MKHALLIGLALVLASSGVSAQEPGITVTTLLSHDKLAAGQTFRVAVVMDLAEPWHVNANPTTLPEFVPTVVSFEANPSVIIQRIDYPKGKTRTVTWADAPVALYEGRVVIFAEGKVKANAPGPVTLRGNIRYQACDDKVCFAPKTIPVSLDTEIVAAGESVQLIHPEIFGSQPAADRNSIAELIQQRGWFWALLAVFFGGLALNLTPCVYPMITITVSYFAGTESRSRQHAFTGALVYCFGIVASYSALGVVAALTGGILGELLQSRWVLLAIAGLLVVLALSLFGLFEIRPPSFLVQRAAGMSTKAGYLGVFFLGATMGIVAAPCLAPFVVALLAYVGTTRQWWWFLIFSTGLALPYLVLGTFSGLLARLPRSGTWLLWVKRAFGTALLIVAVWFAWPVLGLKMHTPSRIAWQTFAPELIVNPGQPVVIDFSADWCIPCREMDKFTFQDDRVVAAVKEFRMLKADLTATGSAAVEQLKQDYRIRGVPTFVFLDAKGREHTALRQVGFVRADDFLTLLARAKPPAEITTNTGTELRAR